MLIHWVWTLSIMHADTLGLDSRCVYTDDTLTGGGLVRLRLRRDPDMRAVRGARGGKWWEKVFASLLPFIDNGVVSWFLVSWVGFRGLGFVVFGFVGLVNANA